MTIKTENLAIVMTDMAGFTEATVHQSRIEIEQLLDTHNRILFPIVRRFKGRHIKSIGDALLLVFRSPTDAMLCAMAMQDALYEYNRSTPKEKQIHMRVGASLGEVRVTRHDIFGEPVNMTSRVCGVTPPDEIYLSEALYMAMNKAEVPSQEVGWKELKGISQPVRIYNIPRFAVPRLVPDVIAAEDMSDLVYPYGGAHLTEQTRESRVISEVRQVGRGVRDALKKKPVRIAIAAVLAAPALLYAVHLVRQIPRSAPPAVAKTPRAPAAVVERNAPVVPEPPPAAETRAPPPESWAPVALGPQYTRLSEARRALKENKLDRTEYRRAVTAIESSRDREINLVRRDLSAGHITKAEYKARVEEIVKRYE
jgi:class 3 adenylate cyclase